MRLLDELLGQWGRYRTLRNRLFGGCWMRTRHLGQTWSRWERLAYIPFWGHQQ